MFHPDLPRIQCSALHHTHYITASITAQYNSIIYKTPPPPLLENDLMCGEEERAVFHELLSWVTAIHLPPSVREAVLYYICIPMHWRSLQTRIFI